MTHVLVRNTDTQREESPGKTETETEPGVTLQQAHGEQGLSQGRTETDRAWGDAAANWVNKGWGQPPGAERKAWESLPWCTALPTPRFWTSGLQNCQRILFCCFNPPSLWRLAPTVLVNHHKHTFQEGPVRKTRSSTTITSENCLLFESII